LLSPSEETPRLGRDTVVGGEGKSESEKEDERTGGSQRDIACAGAGGKRERGMRSRVER